METINKITKWIKYAWPFLSVYLIIVLGVAFLVFYKQVLDTPAKEQAPPVDLTAIYQRISLLEKQVEQQSLIIKVLESKIDNHGDSSASAHKQLEKRIQAQTEVIKRICEYVLVITVDKKIIPRQCLPEYRWNREDGN